MEKEKRRAEGRRFKQLKGGGKAKDLRIVRLQRIVAEMLKACSMLDN